MSDVWLASSLIKSAMSERSLVFRHSHFVRRYAPLGLIDAVVAVVSLSVAWAAGATAEVDIRNAPLFGLVVSLLCLGVNHRFRLYQRVWRYASAGEVVVIGAAVATSTVLLVLIDLLWPDRHPVPLSAVWLMGLFAFVGFVSVRYRQRVWTGFRWRLRALQGEILWSTRVLIVGAGDAGQLLAWRFQNQQEGENYELVGFVDDDSNKHGMLIHGVPVLGDCRAIPNLVTRHRAALIVIAIYNISGDEFRAILDLCQQTSALIKVLPDTFEFLRSTDGQAITRNITAEDLLGRKTIEIDRGACRDLLASKTVLVTGAAGSIGSELCRRILSFAPRRLLALDTNETGLHDLIIELQALVSTGTDSADREQRELTQVVIPIVGDVTNETKMSGVFGAYRPEFIFHAAAYKHVPLMEAHPDEAVRVNVSGTKVVAHLSAQYGAERFVLVSTDKAVNPSSVMGATKRICEMMITDAGDRPECSETFAAVGVRPQAILDLSQRSNVDRPRTLFTAVRFGNVLGSRGSVVPIFERQIEHGGPVTVTHPEMTRYFMSVSEAVSLVIQAATLTQGGDIFMLDMGQRIRIDDLARRLIRLRGLRPDVDVPIVYTGPRPGEKMHEELLGNGEEREPTSHPHIFRVRTKDKGLDTKMNPKLLEELTALAEEHRKEEVVHLRGLVWPTPRAPQVAR